ncbi:hypothetical protein D3C84_595330 [compost metagenome]
MLDDRQVHRREREERAEADHVGHGIEGDEQGNQGEQADQHDRGGRHALLRDQPAEHPGQRAVAAHGEQHPGDAGLGDHRRGKTAGHIGGGKGGHQQFSTHAAHDVQRRRVRVGKGVPLRVDHLREIRDEDKQQATEQAHHHDREGDQTPRVGRFLGHGRHRVETEKGQAENRRARHDQRHAEALMVEGCEQRDGLCLIPQVVDRQRNEHHDEDQLDNHQQQVDPGDGFDADQVEEGHQGNGAEHPHRSGNRGEVFGHVDADQQITEQRQEDVVQQQGPPSHEAKVATEGLARIGIHRSRIRMRLHHASVAVGGQQHGGEGQQVGGGQVALGHLGHQAIGGEHRQRDHISQAEEHERAKPQGLSKPAGRICLRRAMMGRSIGHACYCIHC